MPSLNILFTLLASAGNIILGLFTFIKNPKSATNKLFFLFTTTISLYLVFNLISLTSVQSVSIVDPTISVRMIMFSAIMLNYFFFLLVSTYPNYHLSISRRAFYLITIYTVLMLVAALTPLIFKEIRVDESGVTSVPGFGMPIFLLHTLTFLGGGIIGLANKYKRSSGMEKSQLKFLIGGTASMFFLILLTNFLFVLVFDIISFVGFLPLYTLLFISFISYAIVKHRLLDIRLIVARSATYILLIFLIALSYSGFLYFITDILSGQVFNTTTVVISITLTLFAALTFNPLKVILEKYTDKIFYKDHYDANTVLWNLSRTMASQLELSNICQSILKELLSSFKVENGAVILTKQNTIAWVENYGNISQNTFKGTDIVDLIRASNNLHDNNEHLLIFEELEEGKNKKIMREHEITLALPLKVKSELIGGLILGPKSSGEVYSSEDIDLLKILAPEIAVAVKNALSYEEIKRFNITLEEEIRSATKRLRKANERLKELDKLKDEFVSIASHELRTPMTAIKSYIWMALNKSDQKLKEPLKGYLEISYQSTERLINLVNDMLTVSRIERQKIVLEKKKINLLEILDMIHTELMITAKEKKIDFSLDHKGKEYMVLADKDKLREVFQNIIGNALKFTPQNGRITTKIRKVKDKIITSISDTGPGIRKEDMDKLFQKFGKLEYSYSKHSSEPGSGLGLYISKKIVTLHEGAIEVQSEVEKGTAFTVILPSYSDEQKNK